LAQPNPSARRLCPTRPDGVHALIAQSIEPATCLDRQRRLYHKCYACQYRGLGAEAVLPSGTPEPVPEPKPASPKRKVTVKV